MDCDDNFSEFSGFSSEASGNNNYNSNKLQKELLSYRDLNQYFNKDESSAPSNSEEQSQEFEIQKKELKNHAKTFIFQCFSHVLNKKAINPESIENRLLDDSLFNKLLSFEHAPARSDSLVLTSLKIDTIDERLKHYQNEERWKIDADQVLMGHYRKQFDYHQLVSTPEMQDLKLKSYSTPISELYNYGNQFAFPVESSIDSDSVSVDANKELLTDSKEDVHQILGSISNKENLKEQFDELMAKSLDELNQIVMGLDIEAKIYSELLLSELDYRDKLKRNHEIRNTFIACHLAVEQKNNIKEKRKKKGYTLFRNTENSKMIRYTVPYIHKEGGPTIAELILMIEILKSIEREDDKTAKLISDYVMNLGEEHNLHTVIKVRTQNGLTEFNPGRI